MKFSASIIFLAVFPLLIGFAQSNYTVEQVLFVPPEHYVGDFVEARISLSSSRALSLEAPETLVKNDEITIHEVKIKQDGNRATVFVTFSPFRVGEQQLPPFDLGTITVDDISFTTVSLVEELDYDFQELRDQLLLPGTFMYSALFVCGVVMIVLTLFPGLRIIRERLKAWAEQYTRRTTYKKLMRTIARLDRRRDELDGKLFYTELCEGIKGYLQNRLRCNTVSKTTPELVPLLQEQLGIIEEEHNLCTIFTFGDRVKFGGASAPAEKREAHLEAACSAAGALEEREARHV